MFAKVLDQPTRRHCLSTPHNTEHWKMLTRPLLTWQLHYKSISSYPSNLSTVLHNKTRTMLWLERLHSQNITFFIHQCFHLDFGRQYVRIWAGAGVMLFSLCFIVMIHIQKTGRKKCLPNEREQTCWVSLALLVVLLVWPGLLQSDPALIKSRVY